MNISKLKVGVTFKNYKVMCEELGIKIKQGADSKKCQFRDLEQYAKFKRDGQKIIVVEVYETPIPKYDGRGKNPNSRNRVKPIYLNNPKLAAQWLVEENGMELPKTLTRTSTEEYWWECPDCLHKIFSSPAKRFNKSKAYRDEFITCPYCTLSKGAKVIYDFLEYHNIHFKMEYMFDDLLGVGGKKLRFDFALFNEDDNLVTLIEYDGGYHDEELNPDIEKHKIVSTHDAMKNVYCYENNIHLLRIHHSRNNEIKIILSKYLEKLNLQLIEYNGNIFDLIEKYEMRKKALQSELFELDNTINYFKSLVL